MIINLHIEKSMKNDELSMRNMKIFLSYGHDTNAPLIEDIKELSLEGCGRETQT